MSREHDPQESRENKIGMTPEEEEAYRRDPGAQAEPGDGGIGEMTDTQDRTPGTDN